MSLCLIENEAIPFIGGTTSSRTVIHIDECFHFTVLMDKRIIVIGAGASGIAAATELVSNGFKNVTILEAGNRIGGRINTIPFGANVVDLGAQWFASV